MSVRKYDSVKDALFSNVFLNYSKQVEVVPGRLENVWVPSAGGVLLVDEADGFQTVDEALAALNEAGWLHLPVTTEINLRDFKSDLGSHRASFVVYDPDEPRFNRLFADPSFSVDRVDNDRLRVRYLAEKNGKLVLDEDVLTGDRAREAEKVLTRLRNSWEDRWHKRKFLAQHLELEGALDEYHSSRDIWYHRIGDNDDAMDIQMWQLIDDHAGSVGFIVTSEYARYWEGQEYFTEVFGNVDQARAFMYEKIQKYSADYEAGSTTSPKI